MSARDRFDVSYYRHTGEWFRLFEALSLTEPLDMLQRHGPLLTASLPRLTELARSHLAPPIAFSRRRSMRMKFSVRTARPDDPANCYPTDYPTSPYDSLKGQILHLSS
jgi:hypothetical protein